MVPREYISMAGGYLGSIESKTYKGDRDLLDRPIGILLLPSRVSFLRGWSWFTL